MGYTQKEILIYCPQFSNKLRSKDLNYSISNSMKASYPFNNSAEFLSPNLSYSNNI